MEMERLMSLAFSSWQYKPLRCTGAIVLRLRSEVLLIGLGAKVSRTSNTLFVDSDTRGSGHREQGLAKEH